MTQKRKLSSAEAHFLKDAVQNKLTKEEIIEHHTSWFDIFPTGQATQELFESKFKILLRKSDIDVNHLFIVMDQDRSGTISFEEFLFFISSSHDPKDMAELVFNVFDINGDGYLSKDEIRQSLVVKYKKNGKNIADDKIIAEIEQRIEKLFTVADVNHDGRLSLDEVFNACDRDPSFFVF